LALDANVALELKSKIERYEQHPSTRDFFRSQGWDDFATRGWTISQLSDVNNMFRGAAPGSRRFAQGASNPGDRRALESRRMYPCSGLRVLDLSRVVAGPIAGRILSDLGADVVKLEPPEGDVTRVWGQQRHGLSGFYTQQNAGKRNVCVDLRAGGATEIVTLLASKADVVIENFRAGVIDRLGLGYERLRVDNPRLIMLSVSGFGRGGPDSGRPAYAPSVQAETGLVFRQAQFDDVWPTDPMLSIADTYAGLHGTIAVLAALRLRDQRGTGQHIDMAMFDAMIFTDDYAHHAVDNEPVVRLGGDIYDTCIGPVLFAGQLRTIWNALKTQIDDPAPGDVPIPEKARLRKQAVQAWALTFDAFDDLAAALDRAGLAFGVVTDQFDVVHSPTAQHRGTVAEIDDNSGTGATRGVVQTPYRFSDAESGVRGAAPHRGQHNADVLREWAGLDDVAIAGLVDAGVLRRADDV
jgi:CoA:oxalate CoA-transferase